MPVEDKAAKQEVTFALAIVKAHVISDQAESSRIKAALQVVFPGIYVILVAEEKELAHPDCQYRQELSDFADDAACRVIPSSRITAN